MGLFNRGTKRWIRQIEEMARDWRPNVPKSYPDGTPFPAEQPFDDVVAVAKTITRAGYPEPAGIFCLKLLAHLSTLNDEPFYRASFFGVEAPEVRHMLLQAGMRNEERALSAAGLLALDYHEKAGHRVVMNIDAAGNPLAVDKDGNLLDDDGNILPVDEQGRPIL